MSRAARGSARPLLIVQAMAEKAATLQLAPARTGAGTAELCHDLRAPLQAISGFASLLREEKAAGLDDEGIEYLDRIAAAMDRLLDVVETHRSIGLWREAGTPLETIAAARALRRATGQIGDLIRGHHARVVILGQWPEVLGHEGALAQVLANVIGNAVRHGKPASAVRVEIEGRIEGQQMRISVRDNGPGIDPLRLPEVASLLTGRGGRGSARGLAIAAELAQAMGARIELALSPLGGAGFDVILDRPAAVAAAHAPEPRPALARPFARSSGLGRAGLRPACRVTDARGLHRGA